MTQLARYIESMKMDIHGVRLVQFNPYVSGVDAGAEPIDTHLYLNGDAPPGRGDAPGGVKRPAG